MTKQDFKETVSDLRPGDRVRVVLRENALFVTGLAVEPRTGVVESITLRRICYRSDAGQRFETHYTTIRRIERLPETVGV